MTEQDKKMLDQYMAEQEIISKEIFKKKGAQFIGMGKTKAMGLLLNDQVMMRFLDSYTGTAGVKDGGGNEVAGHMAGLGHMNLSTTWKIFEMLQAEGIPTQNLSIDEINNILVAKYSTLLGKGMPFEKDGTSYTSGGVEVIGRNIALGSFLKRHPHIKEGASLLDVNGNCLVETSVKHDVAGDPIYPYEYFVQNGVNERDIQSAMEMTQHGTKVLTDKFAQGGYNFADTKFEFGYDNAGNLILVDEISTGTSRVLHPNGKKASEKEVYNAVMEM